LGEFVGAVPDLASLPWQVVSVDDVLVDEAARLKSSYPISFADCFAAALAQRYNAPVITGDPDFKKLAERGVVRVEWIGA
jgi:ribonuclease VapC